MDDAVAMDVEEPRPATPEPASVVAAALADAASADGIADGLEEDQAKDQAGAEEAALAGPGDMEAEAEDGEGGGGAGEDDDEAPPTPKRRKNMAGDITIPKGSVKRVIKLDKDVRLVSAEAVLAISKATEFFLERLSMRAHEHSADDAEEPGVIK